MKNGENGRGLASRWYPETLKKRINEIVDRKRNISFMCGDGIAAIDAHAKAEGTVFYIDPPYIAAGRRLYMHSEVDHGKLFATAAAASGDVLMSYDDADAIHFLAGKYGFETARVAMKSTHHVVKNELLIGKDLDWLRNPTSLSLS